MACLNEDFELVSSHDGGNVLIYKCTACGGKIVRSIGTV